MFQKQNLINNLNGFQLVKGNLYSFNDSAQLLCEYDLDGNLKWTTERLEIFFRYQVTDKYIFYSQKNKNMGIFILDRISKNILKNELTYLNFGNKECIKDKILYSFYKGQIIVYDLLDLQIKSSFHDNTLGLIEKVTDDFIITVDATKIYKYNNLDFTLLWQSDVSQLCSYTSSDGTHPGEINNIYYTHEKVIVLTGLSVIAFSINDGSIVWHTKLDTWQSRGLLQEQYLYTTSNAYINKIDINTGDIYYQREFDYVTINGRKDLGPVSEFVWHKNAIWSIMDTNPSTLIALNPEDGSFNYVIPLPELGIKFDCQPPKFDGNRMYLLDFNHTLHIFERE